MLGRFYLYRRKLDQASRELGIAVELQPGSFWANYFHGLCAFQRGEFERARESFRVCLALNDKQAWCFFNRAVTLEKLKDQNAARRDYDRALELEPNFSAAYLNRGILNFNEGRLAEAAADLEVAQQCGGNTEALRRNLALVRKARSEGSK